MSKKNKIKIRTFDSVEHIGLIRKMGEDKSRVLEYSNDVCYSNDILVAILNENECVAWVAVTRGKQVLFVYDYEIPQDLFNQVMLAFLDIYKLKVKHMRRYIDLMVHSEETDQIRMLTEWGFRAVAIHTDITGTETEDGYLFRYRPEEYGPKHPEIPEWYGSFSSYDDIAEVSKG